MRDLFRVGESGTMHLILTAAVTGVVVWRATGGTVMSNISSERMACVAVW